MAMTFGIHVGHLGGPMDEMRKLWRFADGAGFDWTSVADHFQESPPQAANGRLDTQTGNAMPARRWAERREYGFGFAMAEIVRIQILNVGMDADDDGV